MMRRLVLAALLLLLVSLPGQARAADDALPDVIVIDQNGQSRHFYSDLVKGRTVAIDFFYTTCTSFCRPLSSNLAEVQERLSARMGKDVALISISIDPATDTPARLKEFAAKFDQGPGWTFVTGARADIAKLLDRMGQTLGNPEDHMPLVLVHSDAAGGWTHIDGYDPDAIVQALTEAAGPVPAASHTDAAAAARAYMTNPLLVTQDGQRVRLFDDLMDGRIVLINFMLTGCQDVCPPETTNLARVQDLLGDRLGRSVVMLSLTVDPFHDGPAELKKFSSAFGVRKGWYFLTGDPEEMALLERKLGGYTSDPADHSSGLIAGNVASGTWIKLLALDDPAGIARQVLALADPPTH
jgi:protein SCO1/2